MLALGRLLELTLAGREPTDKVQVTAQGTRLRWWGSGVLEVRPPQGQDDGHDVLLSAGLHGHQTAPVALLDRLVRSIARGAFIPRTRLLFVFGNPEAMQKGQRHVEQDLNGLFKGRHASTSGTEALRAAELEQHARVFFSESGRVRAHYDLHTLARDARFVPFAVCASTPARLPSPQALRRVQAAGVQAIVLQGNPSFTFSAFTREHLEAEAFTLELGRDGALDSDVLDARLRPLIGATNGLGGEPEPLRLFRVSREIIKHSDRFRLHLPPDIQHFTPVSHGSLLAEDLSSVRWTVEERGARILFANAQVRMGARAAILVVPDAGEWLT